MTDKLSTDEQIKENPKPLTLVFGEGKLGVSPASEDMMLPVTDIVINALDTEHQIGAYMGNKGKSVSELENVLLRMNFKNKESAEVLLWAVQLVVDGFDHEPKEG